jgi:hypothetical protein
LLPLGLGRIIVGANLRAGRLAWCGYGLMRTITAPGRWRV